MDPDARLEEAKGLALAIGLVVAEAFVLPLRQVRPATLFGEGQIERMATVCEQEEAELVGVIEGHRLSLYLDHAADNSPVPDATLELELGGKPLAVTRVGEGLYQAELSQPLADGETPVTATVVAGADSDLLAADIDWHAPATAVPPTAWAGKSRLALAGGAVLLALAALWAWSRRTQRTGGAA